ncbi:34705_t:CDS:2, partial [Racocetra persica]
SKVSGAKWAGVSFVKISIQQSETLLTRPESILILSDVILTLSNMFGKTINKPELQREVTSHQLPRFNTTLLNLSENKELLCPDGIFDHGSNCLASITNTGGKTNSFAHWKSISLRLIGSLNFLLNRLFDTINE